VSSFVQYGPAMSLAISTTRNPANAPVTPVPPSGSSPCSSDQHMVYTCRASIVNRVC
jgi:hypothetical protein